MLSSFPELSVAPKETEISSQCLNLGYTHFVYATLVYKFGKLSEMVDCAKSCGYQVHLAMIVRHPVERAISELGNHRMAGRRRYYFDTSENLETICKVIAKNSSYKTYIEEIRQKWSGDKSVSFSILRFNAIYPTPSEHVLRFLEYKFGCTSAAHLEALSFQENSTRIPKLLLLDKLVHGTGILLQNLGLYSVYNALLRLNIHQAIKRLNSKKSHAVSLEETQKIDELLKVILRDEINYYETL